MASYSTEKIRNFALVSHGGVGKTSLADAILYDVGKNTRQGKPDDNTSLLDYTDEEHAKKITLGLKLANFEHKGHKLNLVDTPGDMDFLAETFSMLDMVDSLVVLVCGVSGVEINTAMLWDKAEKLHLPRVLFVSRLDRERADFDKAMASITENFGVKCFPLTIPIGKEHNLSGVVDLVKGKAYEFEDNGRKAVEIDVPADLQGTVDETREKILEAVADADDELAMKYLEGEALTDEEIQRGIRNGVLEGAIYPVLCGSASANIGIQPLLNFVVDYLPSPKDRPARKVTDAKTGEEVLRAADPSAPLSAQVFKTMADPFAGKLTIFRVFSGTFKGDSTVYNSTQEVKERIGGVFVLSGKNNERVPELAAGDIGAVVKLDKAKTGDTFCADNEPVKFTELPVPEPIYSLAAMPKSQADSDKMSTGFARMQEEDPCFRYFRHPETSEFIIAGMGQRHLEVMVEKLKSKFGVEIVTQLPQVPYKETIRGSIDVEGKHKKQSGGRGQFGVANIKFEPNERGNGFEFVDAIVGGVIAGTYIPAVKKGLEEGMDRGLIAGYPAVDIKATLHFGKMHPVDSSEMAFKMAGIKAWKEVRGENDKNLGMSKPIILEPVYDVEVRVPEQFMGDVMGDLNSRRARLSGMEAQGKLQVIKAQAPLAEMQEYVNTLRSITGGQGTFSMVFSHYDPVPGDIQKKIVEARKMEMEEED